ncbi:hypothetical protein BC834DRAFT_965540 [Gloeopeniophorella convolvens]|nr:hypothetical protein BC834DRAFT_965540 [Gloeopeniophorella convolvens]
MSDQETTPPAALRRIVTTHTPGGAGTISTDAPCASHDVQGMPGVRSGLIWVADVVPSGDNNRPGVDGACREVPAPGMVMPNGVNCMYNDLAPGAVTPMHRTSSVDLNILIEGELVLIMDDGSERTLTRPGDTVVQRGTLHAWRNPGTAWTRWTSVIIAAEPVDGQ